MIPTEDSIAEPKYVGDATASKQAQQNPKEGDQISNHVDKMDALSPFDTRMFWLTLVGIAIAFLTAVFFYRQLGEMQTQTALLIQQSETGNADASWHAVQTYKQLGAELEQAKAASRNAVAAEKMVLAVRQGIEESARRNKEVLDATIAASRLDERAWVGLVSIENSGGTATERQFTIETIKLVARNSGKTPALKLAIKCCEISQVSWNDHSVPDYDEEILKRKEERERGFKTWSEDLLRSNPNARPLIELRRRTYEEIDREEEASQNKLTGEVLPPGVTNTFPVFLRTRLNQRPNFPEPPLTTYVLGKITYRDVFAGTSIHNTKFCLMNLGSGYGLDICPSGNLMD
jgi:hypothetical protein